MKLIDCICNFVLLNPQISQAMIEKLLLMLRDPDLHVRFSLAKRIGVLFQSVKLVVLFKDKLVKANEDLAGGHQPRPIMETIIVTLMHLALNRCLDKADKRAVEWHNTSKRPCKQMLMFFHKIMMILLMKKKKVMKSNRHQRSNNLERRERMNLQVRHLLLLSRERLLQPNSRPKERKVGVGPCI